MKRQVLWKVKTIDKIYFIIEKEHQLQTYIELRNKIVKILESKLKDTNNDEESKEGSDDKIDLDQTHVRHQEFFLKKIDGKIEHLEKHLKDTQIPEHFNCVFTQCLISDPFTTFAGISYSKNEIMCHVRTRGDDPVTRTPVRTAEVFPNIGKHSRITHSPEEWHWTIQNWVPICRRNWSGDLTKLEWRAYDNKYVYFTQSSHINSDGPSTWWKLSPTHWTWNFFWQPMHLM